MLRRHVTLADSSQRIRCRAVVSWSLPAVASLAVLIAGSPPAGAVARQAKPAPQTLWSSFPLNPTGERLGPKVSLPTRATPSPSLRRPDAVAGPSAGGGAADAGWSPGSDVIAVALVAGIGFVSLFALVGLAGTRLRHAIGLPSWHVARPVPGTGVSDLARALAGFVERASRRVALGHPRARQAGRSPGRVRGVLLVPLRLLPAKLGRLARQTRSAVWTGYSAFVLVGCALAVVLALLVVRMVG